MDVKNVFIEEPCEELVRLPRHFAHAKFGFRSTIPRRNKELLGILSKINILLWFITSFHFSRLCTCI